MFAVAYVQSVGASASTGYGSLSHQVLTFLSDVPEGPPVEVGVEYAGGCAGRVCET